MASGRWHNIVVCCDGTWCGAETGTRTNIQILADAFATSDPANPVYTEDASGDKTKGVWYRNEKTNSDVVYFSGVGTKGIVQPTPGLLGGFLDLLVYCINMTTARDLGEKCREAYRFIKDHYKGPDQSRIWLFGLSRGAYTVRAVAGMINNCGIVKNNYNGDPADHMTTEAVQEALVQKVWDIYSSNTDDCKPHGSTSEQFRSNHQVVWPRGTNPPIVFMGLLDTAGAAGVPRIDGVGIKPLTYDYVPMRDFAVSSEVQHVFQACSTQDRFTPFAPCFVRRKEQYTRPCSNVDMSDSTGQHRDHRTYKVPYITEEFWYPGAHYDLGRQDFVFGNQPIINAFNETVNVLRTNVKCLPELADYPLVGHELKATGKPYVYPADPNNFPPCIVGSVWRIDHSMLPHPSNTTAWQTLVNRPVVRRRPVLTWGAKFVRMVGDVTGAVVSYLPLPPYLQPFQPAYTIDAETKILGTLAKVVGFGLHGAWDERVVLSDRTIPVPGVDQWGFRIGKAKFFPVPSDHDRKPPDSFNSYKPDGREPQTWFMSRTYDNYQRDLAVWKVSEHVIAEPSSLPVAAGPPQVLLLVLLLVLLVLLVRGAPGVAGAAAGAGAGAGAGATGVQGL